jgi:hypothetical protein
MLTDLAQVSNKSHIMNSFHYFHKGYNCLWYLSITADLSLDNNSINRLSIIHYFDKSDNLILLLCMRYLLQGHCFNIKGNFHLINCIINRMICSKYIYWLLRLGNNVEGISSM